MDGMLSPSPARLSPVFMHPGRRATKASKGSCRTVADDLDATIAKNYIVVTYSRWRRNGVRSRNFGAKQNDFSELLVNPF